MTHLPNRGSWCQSSSQVLDFPSEMTNGMTFKSIQELHDAITKEAKSRNIALVNFYHQKLIPNKTVWTNIRLTCNGNCKSTINLKKQGQRLIITSLKIAHIQNGRAAKTKHGLRKSEPAITGDLSVSLQKTKPLPVDIKASLNTLDRYFKSVSKQIVTQSTKNEDDQVIRGKIRRQSSVEDTSEESSKFQKWCKRHNYSTIQPPSNSNNKQVAFTAVSKSMLQNYDIFGDLLSISLFRELLQERATDPKEPIAAFFIVHDTNARLLLAGIAVFYEDTPTVFARVVKDFFKLHGGSKYPQSIMTEDSRIVTEAISELRRQEGYKGSHLLSPDDSMKPYWDKFIGSPLEKYSMVSEFKFAMATRERFQFLNSVRSLLSSDISRDITKEVLRKYPSIFYCKRRTAFVGLGDDLHQETVILVRDNYHSKLNITEFLNQTYNLDLKLSEKSLTTFKAFEGQVEVHFSNNRLAYIRHNFERRVVERFMENYIKGNSFCIPIEETGEEEERTFSVLCKPESKKYLIKNWKCECLEMERTGISCPHMIMLAALTGERSYLQLIDNRWRKERQADRETTESNS